MAYDGFYSDLSTRGTTNQVLAEANQIKEDCEALVVQAQAAADAASDNGATAGTAAGAISGAAAGAIAGEEAGAIAGAEVAGDAGAAAGAISGAAAGATAGTDAANAVVNNKVNTTDLANASNPALGAGMVGYLSSTVAVKLGTLTTDVASKADAAATTAALALKADAAATTASLALKTNIADLADAATVSKGAALIGRAGQVVKSITELKALLKTTASRHAFLTGYYAQGDGGGGPYWYDSTDTTTADNGGTVIVATDGGRWKLAYQGPVTAKQFGVIADVFDGTTQLINNAQLQKARDWVAANAFRNQLTFPAGVYAYSVSPNWAIQNAKVTSIGEARFRYFGTGNAVIIDHGPTVSTYLFNVTMGPFFVEAPSTAQHGVYIRSIHHSRLEFKVRGAGTTYAGIKVDFAVCTDFTGCSCYPNDDGNWYLGAKPLHGLWLAKRNAGEQVSYSLFNNTIWEGLDQSGGAGILLEGTLGNVFNGGTAERCNHGVITTTEAIQNRFYGSDFEANLARDILDNGQGTEYHGVDSAVLVTIGASALFPKFFGGVYQIMEIAAGAKSPLFHAISFARMPGGAISSGEPSCIFRDCFNIQTQKIEPLTQGTITVGASPYNYLNNTGNAKTVAVTGGTISSIILNRAGVDSGLPGPSGVYRLSPGDTLRVTYSVLPNLYFWSD